MRMIVTGGGTGGHIYPAISICKRVKIGIPECDILYVGSHYGPEGTLVKKERIAYRAISVRGFDRKHLFKAIRAGLLLVKSFYQSYKILKAFRPDLVIGTGGYVSGPVVLMASFMGIDTMIHEQNAIPGWTTSMLSRVAKKVLISYKESIPYFKHTNRLFYTGNPVREEFSRIDKAEARAKLGFKEDDVVIFTTGGSLGAQTINRLAILIAGLIIDRPKVHLFHVTGKRYYDQFMADLPLEYQHDRVHVIDYSHEIVELMASANLAVSRSGALALAEMAVLKLPAILIPSPNVANNHQEHNAKAVHKTGASMMLLESELTDERFTDLLTQILDGPEKLEAMSKKYEEFVRENALNTIMSIIYEYNLR